MANSISEQKGRVLQELQDFLQYKRTHTIDFGKRLLKDFKVTNFVDKDKDNYFIELAGYETHSHENHYWIDKKEFVRFISGAKTTGLNLMIESSSEENNKTFFEINMIKIGFKKPTIDDAERLKGILINHMSKVYKSYDVQVMIDNDRFIDKIVRVFVQEPTVSVAEAFVKKNIILQNKKSELSSGMFFEDFTKKEEYVKKEDALTAIALERESVKKELTNWFLLNVKEHVNEPVSNIILSKLKE